MGDDNVGMKTGHRRQSDKAFFAQIMVQHNARKADNPRNVKDASDVVDAHIMARGWADHYGETHVMNAHHFWIKDMKRSIKASDFDRRCFAGNSGYCRFYAPYQDAYDVAFVAGADRVDCRVAGYKAMMDFYGVDAPFWAWWD
jgi:hypothetical protein